MRNIKVMATALDGREQVTIRAGRMRTERVVPPAGEDYAFDVEVWDHTFTVYASPTGRSVRLWIDNEEVEI